MTDDETELTELRIELARAQGSLKGFERGAFIGFVNGALIVAFLAVLWEKFHG